MKEILSPYPVIVETPVAWGEMDAFGHVNNIYYFRYFETGRIAYFERIRFMEHKEIEGAGPILASASCRYLLPLTYPDDISVGTRVIEMSEDRFTHEYIVVSHRHEKIAAKGRAVIVSFDYRKNEKTPLPDIIRERIEDIEGKDALSRTA